MASANYILELARKELGTKESPAGSNNVKYNQSYYGRSVSGDGYPWCAVFLWWLFQQAGAAELYYDGGKTAYVPTLIGWANGKGLLADTPQPGDLICFDFNANQKADHIGICESWDGQYVTTIDGNTGTTNEANGGCVMRRRRHKKYILAVIRPRYEEDDMMTQNQFNQLMDGWMATQGKGDGVKLPTLQSGAAGKQVKAMQALLTGYGYRCSVDGSFGPATDKALRGYQRSNGLTADGSCGPATWAKLLGL